MNAINHQRERSKLPVAMKLLLGCYEVAINLLRRMEGVIARMAPVQAYNGRISRLVRYMEK